MNCNYDIMAYFLLFSSTSIYIDWINYFMINSILSFLDKLLKMLKKVKFERIKNDEETEQMIQESSKV